MLTLRPLVALHSNMFLLILIVFDWFPPEHDSLHSNMFLLIQKRKLTDCSASTIFTFQYVSINTVAEIDAAIEDLTLHSNMFLLILIFNCIFITWLTAFTFQYVSINTKASIHGSRRQ